MRPCSILLAACLAGVAADASRAGSVCGSFGSFGMPWTTGQVKSKLLGAGALGSQEGGVATTQNGKLIFAGAAVDDTLRVFDAQLTLLHAAAMPTTGVPGRVRVERS